MSLLDHVAFLRTHKPRRPLQMAFNGNTRCPRCPLHHRLRHKFVLVKSYGLRLTTVVNIFCRIGTTIRAIATRRSWLLVIPLRRLNRRKCQSVPERECASVINSAAEHECTRLPSTILTVRAHINTATDFYSSSRDTCCRAC